MEALPTVRQLQHLTFLAKEGSFSKAAQVAGVTQSTLSASIKELEQVLGGVIAERGNRQFYLTPLGEQIVERSQTVLTALRDLTALAQQQAAPLSGTLRLGVIPTISPFLLPRLLPHLRDRYPKLKLFLREGQTDQLLDQLNAGDLDILLLAFPCDCDGSYKILVRDPFLVALRPDHPLAKLEKIKPSQLRDEPLLTLQDGHCLRDQMLSACGVTAMRGENFAATSLHTLVQMVENGLGVTLLPTLAIKAGLLIGTKLVTRPILGDKSHRDVTLLWRKGSAREEEFIILSQLFKGMFGRGGI